MKKDKKHSFLKRVVTLCLIMMSIITVGVVALAWHSGEQLSSSTVASLVGAWCGELLMTLLKRNSDTKKEIEELVAEADDFEDSLGLEEEDEEVPFQDQI